MFAAYQVVCFCQIMHTEQPSRGHDRGTTGRDAGSHASAKLTSHMRRMQPPVGMDREEETAPGRTTVGTAAFARVSFDREKHEPTAFVLFSGALHYCYRLRASTRGTTCMRTTAQSLLHSTDKALLKLLERVVRSTAWVHAPRGSTARCKATPSLSQLERLVRISFVDAMRGTTHSSRAGNRTCLL